MNTAIIHKGDKPVTLKTIAALAGCCASSVSTVLNNSHGNSVVGEETRKRILKIANELGYCPNYASRSLRNNCSKTIGVYVHPHQWRRLGNFYESAIFNGVETGARQRGYDVIILNMNTSLNPEICDLHLRERRVDGVVLIHVDKDVAESLARTNANVVAIDCAFGSNLVNRIIFDDEKALDLAVAHLKELGHHRIGFIGRCTNDSGAPRELYFSKAIAKYQGDMSPNLIFNQQNCNPPIGLNERFCQREGQAAFHYFTSLDVPPTAVISYNSLVGVSFLNEATRSGIKIPDELSLIGIDDYEFLEYVDPNLTVVDHVLEELGQAGSHMLIALLEKRCSSPVQKIISPRLISRNSCSSPRIRTV